MDYSFIYLIHILFGGPLLIYGGYVGRKLSEICNNDDYNLVFMSLIIVGIIVVLYHSYKLFK